MAGRIGPPVHRQVAGQPSASRGLPFLGTNNTRLESEGHFVDSILYFAMERPSIFSAPRTTTICSSLLKQVFLHDWWLIKVDSDSSGKRLGVGGLTSKQRNRGIRSFFSAAIVTRHDAVTLRTVDNITVLLHGHINRSRTLENGFSHELCEDFHIGFPYYWEEFAAVSNGEDSAPFSCSGASRTSPPGDCSPNMTCRNLFDEILKNCDDDFCGDGGSSDHEESPLKTRSLDSAPEETVLNHETVDTKQTKQSHSNNVKTGKHNFHLWRRRRRARLLPNKHI